MDRLSLVDTLVVVMLENRSFDHQLGYRSLPGQQRPGADPVDGIQLGADGIPRFGNRHLGLDCRPFPLNNPGLPYDDPPHGLAAVQRQLGAFDPAAGGYPMDGFVASYAEVHPLVAPEQAAVMGYLTPREVPTSDFFANQFAISDRWFAPVPTSTQPNRLMALAGYTLLDDTHDARLPEHDLVYDWLTRREIQWRVYHDGAFPFETLMPSAWKHLLSRSFRHFGSFALDYRNESALTFPSVIFIEPAFADAHAAEPNDDHPPCSARSAQALLRRIYEAVTSNPERWARTMLVVTYDEHGGFFDHVSPPRIRTDCPPGAHWPGFESLGPRVPAYVVSPLVRAGQVTRPTDAQAFDHTSILKLIGERWGRGSYSPVVDARPVGSLSQFLSLDAPRKEIPAMPTSPMVDAFRNAARELVSAHGMDALKKYPGLTGLE